MPKPGTQRDGARRTESSVQNLYTILEIMFVISCYCAQQLQPDRNFVQFTFMHSRDFVHLTKGITTVIVDAFVQSG